MPKNAGADVVSETNDPQQILFKTLPDLETLGRESLGKAGAVSKNGTTAVSGNFGAIQVLADATFSALTATNWTGDSLANLVVPAGVTIFGDFTGFTLSSGRVLAYLNAST
jgi:hypothetical protein